MVTVEPLYDPHRCHERYNRYSRVVYANARFTGVRERHHCNATATAVAESQNASLLARQTKRSDRRRRKHCRSTTPTRVADDFAMTDVISGDVDADSCRRSGPSTIRTFSIRRGRGRFYESAI